MEGKNGQVITPVGVSAKDGMLRLRVEERDVKGGIVFGKKTGFLEATTMEGYEALQTQLKENTLAAVMGKPVGNGLYEVTLVNVATV